MSTNPKHTFSFFRAGGFDQVRLETGADLLALEHLDQKLWFALACPTRGIEADARTLELLDTQKDGRIRANELIGAANFAGRIFKNPDDLLAGKAALPLSALRDSDEGRRIQNAARAVLQSLGKAQADALSIEDMAAATRAFDAQPFNGDGVVPVESATDDATRAVAADVLACMGPEADRGGKPGINQAKIDAFFKELEAHAAWLAKGETEAIRPFGEGTAAAHAAVAAVRARVDDYFLRCKVASFDGRAVTALNREDKEWLAIGQKELSASGVEVAAFPLARVEAGRALPLSGEVNPAWEAGLKALAEKAVAPLYGAKTSLTYAEWTALLAKLEAHAAWVGAKAGAAVEKLGAARVKELLSGKAKEQLAALMALEKQQEPVATALLDVERAVRYHRDLYRLTNNFVSFKDFYGRQTPAVFQAGTLYLDQRACELCIRVEDAGKHATMAPLSRAYLAYCDLARPATGEKMTIAAAFTAGDSDNLMVGRNGVFYDRAGNDWDATITKIVDNPISIRQAFWAPYKKLVRFVEEQVAKRAAAADTASTAALTGAATRVEKAADTGKADAPLPPKKIDIGTVAALGVAVGGITAALGAMLEGLFGLGLWMPLGLLGLLLFISGPSMVIAALKLRQRSLGPLLDANGWALNAPGRINIPFGASLTRVAELPEGARRDLSDPFADKPRPWGLWIFLAVVLLGAAAWYLGKVDHLLPTRATSTSVLGENAPASRKAAQAAPPAPEAKVPAPAEAK